MRIGLISYEYPPQQGLGGVGTYFFRLAGALGGEGHDVHVITGPSDRPPVSQPGVTVHRIPADFDPRSDNRLLRWLYWQAVAGPCSRCHPVIWHWLKWNLAALSAIRRIDAVHRFDVVEAPEHAGNGWAAGHVHRWPLVVRMHCPWEMFVRINRMPFNPMHRLMAVLERRGASHYADAITVPSQAMAREVLRNWKLRRPPQIIPNFMSVPDAPADLPDPGGPERILCAGRIEPLKGQDALARAFALLARRRPRAELWIIGPDRWGRNQPFSELLEKIVPDPEIRRRIHLPGLIPLQQMHQHLLAASVAVVNSIGFESFSYSALEAMAAARPTVVTRVGALPELIDHERNGLLTTPDEPHELASCIERLLDDAAFARRCGHAAHATARDRYDTRRVLPMMLDTYEQAADFFYKDRLMPTALQRPAMGASWMRALIAT